MEANKPESATSIPERKTLDDDAGPLDIRELFAIGLTSWPYVLILCALAYIAASYKVFTTAPTYSADALVQVEQKTSSASIAFSQTATAVGGLNQLPTEIAILESRLVLSEVVRELGLDIASQPVFFPGLGQGYWRSHQGTEYGDQPWWAAPFSNKKYAWGGEHIEVTRMDVPDSLRGTTFSVRSLGNGEFSVYRSGNLLTNDGKTGTPLELTTPEGPVKLFVRELKGKPGREFLVTKQPEVLAIERLKSKLRAAAESTRGELIVVSLTMPKRNLVVQTLQHVLDVYQRQNVERRAEEAQRTLEFLSQQLPELKDQVETAEAELNQFKVSQGTADLAAETALLLEQSVSMERRARELRQERTAALDRFTENHPVVQSIDAQIARLQEELSTLSDQVKNLPALQQKALQLTRNVDVATQLYVSLLNRTQELQVVRSGTVGNIRVIDHPVIPHEKNSFYASRVYLLYMVIAAALGLGLGYLVNFLRAGVEDPAEVERVVGIPTYGSIPYSPVQKRLASKKGASTSKLLVVAESSSPAAESMRSIRTAIHFAKGQADNGALMITGPEPDIGKSFVSANLAVVMAQLGQKTLLIDADMRRGHVHHLFNATKEAGLSEFLSGQIGLNQAIRKTAVDGLDIITCGGFPPNPAELLMTKTFANLMRSICHEYEHVVIDTPPVLAVADAGIIGRHAGLSMIVLKAGKHPMRMIEETIRRLQSNGVAVDGTLFNQVGKSLNKYAYGARSYHYSYDYSKR